MAFGFGFGFWLAKVFGLAGPPVVLTWVINPGDASITFVSTPDFPVQPVTFIATAGDGLIQFQDI